MWPPTRTWFCPSHRVAGCSGAVSYFNFSKRQKKKKNPNNEKSLPGIVTVNSKKRVCPVFLEYYLKKKKKKKKTILKNSYNFLQATPGRI